MKHCFNVHPTSITLRSSNVKTTSKQCFVLVGSQIVLRAHYSVTTKCYGLIQLVFKIFNNFLWVCGLVVLDVGCEFSDRGSTPGECQRSRDVDLGQVILTIVSVASSQISNTLLRSSPSTQYIQNNTIVHKYLNENKYHPFLSFRQIIDYTRELDDTRPITFVTHMSPYDDKAVCFYVSSLYALLIINLHAAYSRRQAMVLCLLICLRSTLPGMVNTGN